MLEEILSRALDKAEQAEVYQVKLRSMPVVFEANRLKSAETRESRGIALRVISNGRLGLASTTDLRQPLLVVDAALAVAELGAEARFDLPNPCPSPNFQLVDPAIEGQSVQDLTQLGQHMVDLVRAANSEILCEATVRSSRVEQKLLNSNGHSISFAKTVMSAGISGTLTRNTDILTIDEHTSWGQRITAEQAQDLAVSIVKNFEMSATASRISTGSYPVVFTPKGAASIMVGCLQLALNGKVVMQGASPLGNRLGEQVFDSRITLWDDATIPFAPGSAPFDDEGVLTGRNPLIQGGIVQNFIYDLQTAGLTGRTSTGNGYRALGGLPSPSYTSLVFEEGDAKIEDMIADIKSGVLIDQVMGAWAGNIISGDFSGNIHLGYKIENGQLAGRIKDCMVAGNAFETLKQHVVAIGSPATWEGGALKMPPMYFHSLSISAPE